jgi:hypothetical protein
MFKRPIRSLAAFTMVLAATLAGCNVDRGPTSVTAVPSASEESATWLSLVSTNASETATTVTQVIDSRGGMINVGGHSLIIPRRAVLEDTEFTFTVVGGDHIQVDLKAKRVRDGGTVDTFPLALTLRLSYGNANVSDPSRLKNVYMVDGLLIPLVSSVSTLTRTVASPLSHFSEYGMAIE